MADGANLGLAIQLYREVYGLTQIALAVEAGVSEKTLSAWKKGHRNPDPKLVQKVADALGVLVKDLQDTATYIDRLRIRLGPWTESRKRSRPQASAVAELTDDELRLELGRVRERQLAIEWEIQGRKRSV